MLTISINRLIFVNESYFLLKWSFNRATVWWVNYFSDAFDAYNYILLTIWVKGVVFFEKVIVYRELRLKQSESKRFCRLEAVKDVPVLIFCARPPLTVELDLCRSDHYHTFKYFYVYRYLSLSYHIGPPNSLYDTKVKKMMKGKRMMTMMLKS